MQPGPFSQPRDPLFSPLRDLFPSVDIQYIRVGRFAEREVASQYSFICQQPFWPSELASF